MGLLTRFGVGGPTVDLTLADPHTLPGAVLTGTLEVVGGSRPTEVSALGLMLEAVVEVESGDHEWRESVVFASQPISGPFTLDAGQRLAAPVSLQVPWEAPITALGGWTLRGMQVGVRTRLDVRGGVDPKDHDPVTVHPLPAQQAVLDALARLGWQFRSADLEKGRVPGSQLPFYQEIELHPTRAAERGRINELEVTFVADPHQVGVILEADRRGGFLTSGSDAYARFAVPHTPDPQRVVQELAGQIQRLAGRRW